MRGRRRCRDLDGNHWMQCRWSRNEMNKALCCWWLSQGEIDDYMVCFDCGSKVPLLPTGSKVTRAAALALIAGHAACCPSHSPALISVPAATRHALQTGSSLRLQAANSQGGWIDPLAAASKTDIRQTLLTSASNHHGGLEQWGDGRYAALEHHHPVGWTAEPKPGDVCIAIHHSWESQGVFCELHTECGLNSPHDL